jgi:flagellar motor switch protein FliN/FliY
MTEGVEMNYEELAPAPVAAAGPADIGRLQNVPVELAVEIGRTRMTIGEALALGPGSVVTVGRLAGDPVELLVNGRVIARGEVVANEEELGLRITEIAAPVVEAPPPETADSGAELGDLAGVPGGDPSAAEDPNTDEGVIAG